jgi:hypothetical protein
MKVRLFNEEDTAQGRVPAGTIIDHPDGEWLIRLGKGEEVKEPQTEQDET